MKQTLIFHDDKLLGIFDEWQHTSKLPKLSYIYSEQWYLVTNFGSAMPINLCDVPPYCIKILKMLKLVQPK